MTGREDALRLLASELWLLGRRIRRKHRELIHDVAPELGMNGYALLEALAEQPERRQSDLACAIGVDKGVMSRLVSDLEGLGLVERIPDPSDRRAHLVRLTTEGAERMHRVLDGRREIYEQRFAQWSADDLERLARELARYNATWDD